MSRVVTKKNRTGLYLAVVKDVKKPDGKWAQVVLASFGAQTPETHARAIVACVVLDAIEANTANAPVAAALEREAVFVAGAEAVNRLKETMQVPA